MATVFRVFFLALFCVWLVALWAFPTMALERRRPQFSTDHGYYVVPFPYSLPGFGQGFGLTGGFSNIPLQDTETPVDVFLVALIGDVAGAFATVTDIPLWPEHLLFDVTKVRFNKVSSRAYRERGIDSEPTDYQTVVLSNLDVVGGRMILTFYERMLEFYLLKYQTKGALSSLRDNEGELLFEFEDPITFNSRSTSYGIQLDWTDDRVDPLRGVRFSYLLSRSPPEEGDALDFSVRDLNLTGYLSLLTDSTLVLNWARSSALVHQQGETDIDTIYNELVAEQCVNTICSPAELETLRDQARITQTANRYGTATSLGGLSRLRAYPGRRFNGGQMAFRGVEFRWNLTNEFTPINVGIFKDIRTRWQLAFFHEEGTVAETSAQLWEQKRSAMGFGVRMITRSDLIARLDIARGQEGNEFTLIVGYPWGDLAL